MNRGEVREAIHAKLVGITKWTMCSNVLIYNRKNFKDPVISLLERLVKSGVRVMVYSGDQDAYIPLIGTHSLLQGLAKDTGLDRLGPCCSFTGQGAFSEHGPFQPTRKGGLVLNRYNWYRGVGFSYSTNTSNYFMVTDGIISRDAIVFLQDCFTRFQKYKNSDVFITGVSYAGHWAPQIVELILQTKLSFNLKGITVSILFDMINFN
ncbi:hypothetical protein P8452_14138 [Trifolium repens]|nr:hypothetical protein P8452_14138 [Trifolium repens]